MYNHVHIYIYIENVYVKVNTGTSLISRHSYIHPKLHARISHIYLSLHTYIYIHICVCVCAQMDISYRDY